MAYSCFYTHGSFLTCLGDHMGAGPKYGSVACKAHTLLYILLLAPNSMCLDLLPHLCSQESLLCLTKREQLPHHHHIHILGLSLESLCVCAYVCVHITFGPESDHKSSVP